VDEDAGATMEKNRLISRALAIIADEAALEVSDLDEAAEFTELGIDSLMSLVLAQKFRCEMGVEVRDSIFVEFGHLGTCVGVGEAMNCQLLYIDKVMKVETWK
jgi:acyl carrier protein